MLTLTSVTKRYGALVALNDVSLRVSPGEFLGLLGPNGAGKSTLMGLVAGLKDADSGTLELAGHRIGTDEVEPRRLLGLVPQSIALYTELTALQNLRLFGQLQGVRGRLLDERIEEALSTAQLADRRNDQVRTFSGGMQRRLNIVAALLHNPRLLLCDEPTVGVDPQSRNAIFEHLERLRAGGMTVIYSTHYMEEAERLCSRIAIIDHGRILAQGSLQDLLGRLPFEEELRFPASEQTSAFAAALAGRPGFASDGAEHLFRPGPEFRLSAFYALSEQHGVPSRLFEAARPSLENVFLHLTGRTLRE